MQTLKSKWLFLILILLSSFGSTGHSSNLCSGLFSQNKIIYENPWVDLKKYPPITNDGIEAINEGSFFCGECPVRFFSHLQALASIYPQGKLRDIFDWSKNKNPLVSLFRLINHRSRNDFIRMHRLIEQNPTFYKLLIYVRGDLVGYIKKLNDPSFLALRNVVNSSGDLVLEMGRVYRLSMQQMEELDVFLHTSDGAPSSYESIHLKILELRPDSYLLNDLALDNSYMIDVISGNPFNRFQSRESIKQKVWPNILELIETARSYFETDVRSPL